MVVYCRTGTYRDSGTGRRGRERVSEDSEAHLCCIPSQQQIKLTLLSVTFLLFVLAFLLLVAQTFTYFSLSLFAHMNAYISNQVARLNQSVCPPKFI